MKTNALKQPAVLLSLLLVSCSCRDNDVIPVDGEHTVSFSIRLPQTSNPDSRALGAADENNVQTLDILLFDSNGNYTYQPIYSNITSTSGSNTFTFTVKVPEGTYDMVFLANARQSLVAALPAIVGGTAKATVMNQILVSNSAAWNNTPGSSGYIPIPMWGEVPSITISSTTPASTPVTLSRTLVRIDVSLSAAVQANLSLTSVRLYSYNNQGLVAPVAANWDAVNVVATAPSVPATAQQSVTPLVYSGADITTPGIASQNAIYTFEAVAGNNNFYLNNTCLVIGGLYDGSTTETFYRIDFLDANSAYLPLLRNHTYEVLATTISGPGLNTPDIAFSSRPVNVAATVQTWIASASNNPSINGPYRLTVSEGTIAYSNSGTAGNTVSVYSNYPAGWTLNSIVDSSNTAVTWLTPSASSGTTNSTVSVTLTPTINGTGAARTAYVNITAGRLTYTISVTQPTHSGWAGSNIYWNGTNMTFSDVGVQTDNQYTGLYFNWGSLYGISPVGSWNGTQILYTPSGTSGTGTSLGYTTWASWPRSVSNGANDQTLPYLYAQTNASTGVGDICHHLSNMGWAPTDRQWRMPTAAEVMLTGGTYTAQGSWAAVTAVSQAGTDAVPSGYAGTGVGTPYFPAAGNRSATGVVGVAGQVGDYWNSSPGATSSIYYNYFFSTGGIVLATTTGSASSFPVRCVAE